MRTRARELGAPARLVTFALLLAVIGGIAALAGAATGHGRIGATAGDAMTMAAMTPAQQARANGLASFAGGYTFAPERTTLPRGAKTDFRFRILDGGGHAVHDFDVDGGVRLHLIVVRRDFDGYQHLHPTLQRDGSWAVPLELARAGAYRAFADFETGGQKTVLGTDLFVPGSFTPMRLPAAATSATSDGYDVRLRRATLRAGQETKLHFFVSRAGTPVAAFQRYVGHRGHLVALRAGDLAYSHVHPEPGGRAGEIVFHTELPTAGAYRVFLQFKLAGVVHTAAFTVEVQR